MSLIGVYPDTNLMTKEQLQAFIIHLEVQLIEAEDEAKRQRERADLYKKLLEKRCS